MLVCDRLFIMHSFSLTSTNIAINSTLQKTRFFGLHFCRNSVGVSSTTYLMHLKATDLGEITHGNGLYAIITPFQIIHGYRSWY